MNAINNNALAASLLDFVFTDAIRSEAAQ